MVHYNIQVYFFLLTLPAWWLEILNTFLKNNLIGLVLSQHQAEEEATHSIKRITLLFHYLNYSAINVHDIKSC